jgi:hypothetical protein
MRSVSAYKDITKLDLPFHMPDASPSTTPRLSEIAPKSVAPVVTVGAMSVIAVGETVRMIIVKAITKL